MPPRKSPPAPPPRPFRIEACPPVGRAMIPALPPGMREEVPAAVLDPFPSYHYQTDVDLRDLECHIAREIEVGLELNPEYQREHVWTADQQLAYVEYMLRGGETGRTLITGTVGDVENTPGGGCAYAHYSLVDGKQRLTSLRRFLSDDMAVFAHPGRPAGYLCSEMSPRHLRSIRLHWQRITFTGYREIVRHYLRLNEGGTPHTPEELNRVRALLAATAE